MATDALIGMNSNLSQSDKCPINNPPLAFRKKTDEDTIRQIRELYDSGHTIGEIQKITGCSY